MRFVRLAALAAALVTAPLAAQAACPSSGMSMSLQAGGLASFCSGGKETPMGYAYGSPQGPVYASFTGGHRANMYDDIVVMAKDGPIFYHVSGVVEKIGGKE